MGIEELLYFSLSEEFSLAFITQRELTWYDGLAAYCMMSV
jgi:hypothetical protein